MGKMLKQSVMPYELAKTLLTYDPLTGKFIHLGKTANGLPAGSVDSEGYVLISLNKRAYRAHRLAWLLTHGEWPANQIDHIDGDRQNNRIANLRDVTNQGNQQNRKRPQSNNKSGYLGVALVDGQFLAAIRHNGKTRRIGFFSTALEAYAAYLVEKRQTHEMGTL